VVEALPLAAFSGAYLSRFVLAAVRVLAAVSLNPLLGSTRVPVMGRIGLGLFITLALFPPGPAAAPVTVGPAELIGEFLLGLLAGFTVALVFAAVQFAAGLIGANAGFGIGEIVPGADLGSGALERFFSALALVVFVQIDGHHLFLAGLHDLFVVVPVGAVPLVPGNPERLAVLSAAVFTAGVKMALPVLAALLIADLGLAILARVAPQLNLFALGLPVKMLVALAVLGVALPVVLPRLAALFRALPQSMFGLAG
jgi:flagellar biosynthetic protein FliR